VEVVKCADEEIYCMPNDDLVTVYVAHGEPEAEVIRGALECEGISAELRGELGDSIEQFADEGIGKIEIRVAESDREKAEDIIQSQQES
jgi:hypothetical protein